MKVGVIGGGTVGRATARCWLEHVEEVRVWDIVEERRTRHHFVEVIECGIVMVCLPEGALDEFFAFKDWSMQKDRDFLQSANYVLKSTVPIGTTRRLKERSGLKNVCHSPEFLTARCAVTDAQMPARNIIGSEKGPASCGVETDLDRVPVVLHNLYAKRFPGVPIHHMTFEESEAVKLIQNAFFATKVSFFNECRALADHLGLDWERVMAAVLADGRIAHGHTNVPGHDGLRGWGGACLGKDLKMLRAHFENIGRLGDGASDAELEEADRLCPEVISAVLRRNQFDRVKS